MHHDFDRGYWDEHWRQAQAAEPQHGAAADAPNPYLSRETGTLVPGTALEAGCGEGAEAIWLASTGWRVTAVDIAPTALARASERARDSDVDERVQWVEADLTDWDPGTQFDLVTTHYAHPSIPQLAFYDRIARWVGPGGTLLIVGHLHTADSGHGHHAPGEASATVAEITAGLDATEWQVLTAEEHSRTLLSREGRAVPLRDVVVRAVRHT